jgi:hypothetical protein
MYTVPGLLKQILDLFETVKGRHLLVAHLSCAHSGARGLCCTTVSAIVLRG